MLQAQRDFQDIAKKLGMPSAFPNALGTPVNWYQFGFLMGNGFGLGAGDNSPEGKKKAAQLLRQDAGGECQARLRRLPRSADAPGRCGRPVLLQ